MGLPRSVLIGLTVVLSAAFIRGLHIGSAGSTMYAENYATVRDVFDLNVVTTFA